MRVIAIDPAPGKDSTVYEGGERFREIPGDKMRSFLKGIEDEKPPVLVCWDAPLTGPRNPENAGHPGDFTVRRLDSFFRQEKFWSKRKGDGFKTPPGISVQPYPGCPHWTISRSVLGLPRLGPFDADYDRLPFHLLPHREGEVSGEEVARMDRPCIVEIHPAVAAWLWCKDHKKLRPRSWKRGNGWRYKGDKKDPDLQGEMWEVIFDLCDDALKATLPKLEPDEKSRKPANDDQFDAVIGYILGVKWLRGDDDVVLLGDRENGSMLLPRVPGSGLCEAWEEFRNAEDD